MRVGRADVGAEAVRATSGRSRLAWLVFGVATFFAFGHPVPFVDESAWMGVVDLGLVFAWVVPAALVVAVDGLSPGRAARSAFGGSFLTHVAFFYWFLVVTMVYAGMPIFLGILAPLVPALYVAPFTALFAWAHRRFDGTGLVGIATGAAAWVAIDWIRGHLFGGFPWATLGYALHLDVPALALTRWTGVYGLSFLAAAAGIAIGRLWLARGTDGAVAARRETGIVVGVVVAVHVLAPLIGPGDVSTRTLRVAAVQGNVDQGEKWEASRREQILSRYLALSADAVEAGAQWVVWPETAVPGVVENDRVMRERIAGFAETHGVTLVVGGMGVDIDWEERRFSAFYDSAFVFDPDGALADRYDKTHLVPFGEYLPLRSLLGRFLQSIATGLSSSDVTPGVRPRNLALVAPGARAMGGAEPERILAGIPICYELLFPDLVRRFGDEGAGILLAITNDAWYGRTGAPYQFLAMTALRAAETGLPLVRAANTGVSAMVDARGVVGDRSRLFEETIVVGEVAVAMRPTPTFYARFGDVFAGLCGVAWVTLATRRVRSERNRGEGPSA